MSPVKRNPVLNNPSIPQNSPVSHGHGVGDSIVEALGCTNYRNISLRRMISAEDCAKALHKIREPLADYQEPRGIPKDECLPFACLVTSMCQHAYSAVIVILAMLYNLMPMMDAFLFLARFVIDKLIDILETVNTTDKIYKSIIFIGQLAIIGSMIFMIMTFIIFPIFQLTRCLSGKLWIILSG